MESHHTYKAVLNINSMYIKKWFLTSYTVNDKATQDNIVFDQK